MPAPAKVSPSRQALPQTRRRNLNPAHRQPAVPALILCSPIRTLDTLVLQRERRRNCVEAPRSVNLKKLECDKGKKATVKVWLVRRLGASVDQCVLLASATTGECKAGSRKFMYLLYQSSVHATCRYFRMICTAYPRILRSGLAGTFGYGFRCSLGAKRDSPRKDFFFLACSLLTARRRSSGDEHCA